MLFLNLQLIVMSNVMSNKAHETMSGMPQWQLTHDFIFPGIALNEDTNAPCCRVATGRSNVCLLTRYVQTIGFRCE